MEALLWSRYWAIVLLKFGSLKQISDEYRPGEMHRPSAPPGLRKFLLLNRRWLSILKKQTEEKMDKLKAGDTAPDFSLKDQQGNTIQLIDYRGKKLLLYFYPKADTPGCTKQACSIRDSGDSISAAGIEAVGISPDMPDNQNKFDEKYNLGFPLLSDPDHIVAKAYGAWGEKKMYGKSYMGIIRSSFLIDEEGKIVNVWYKVKPLDTVPKALASV
jgi:peroxiredoxin Q/BCP